MRRVVSIACLLFASASLTCAQATDDYRKNQFFAGYSFNSADINTLTIDPQRTNQNGANIAYTRFVWKNIGLTADASAHFKRDTRTLNGGPFSRKRDQYYFLGGVTYQASTQSRATPFVHALVGASLFRGFTSNITTAGNIFTFDDATSFAMAFGGGVDLKVNNRVAVRLIQADYAPTFFGSGRQDNFRLSVGIVFK